MITVALLAVVVLVVDFRRVGAVLESVGWKDILTATAAYQLGIFVRAYRWQVLLRAQGMRTPYCRLVQLYYIGTFFNTFLPSGFGGDVVKTYELSRQTSSGASAVSTVLVDRLMGLAVLLAMALVALPFSWRYVPGLVVQTLIALIVGFAAALI
ncbi:lysylphosphatidylglycerol synthase transmembrane domain-containing protein, partial [Thermodesulfobacteriota bacterium]